MCDSSHQGHIGLRGKVVDETRNTIKISDGGVVKTLPKDSVTLELQLPGDCLVRLGGSLLVGRPEDRVKKKFRINFK